MGGPLPQVRPAAEAAAIVLQGARSFRRARTAGRPVQPWLFRSLSRRDCGMLAPVLESLMTLYETALGHAFVAGRGAALTPDEQLLLGLIDGSRRRSQCIDCAAGAASALDCAICSTRIMLALALEPAARR